ncbi:LacI family DNA-binding transcriptional regulator [Kribbella sp.]|uniref:LacI family DNA-binding transcriptional regulator n=1 Tax=Kribbella sp. TaxID=1871183 RepID=UPI002D530908|nr:LacI family DNA-binding transcriptional regulator [Kribbella sp.]HZX06509.1 LacI family DNA-binding transcriptional regulator [Kribbella sp.]
MTKRPTIADVARRAGVSKGSVSFALNGRPGLAQATVDKILAAADELGWRPSNRARSLSVSKAFALGLVITRDPAVLSSDPFFPAFIAGVESVLSTRGQALVLQVVADGAEADGYRRLAQDARVDGVFLSDLRHDDPRIDLLVELGLPAVTLNSPDGESPFPAVVLDDRPGTVAVVEHLLGLGHTRIAHVAGPASFVHATARSTALVATLAAAGLSPVAVETGDFTAAGGIEATRRLLALPEPPTAIVYANDRMAIAGLGAAQAAGLTVPDDLSIAGFDDSELAEYVHPGLTTVRADPFRFGVAAAGTLNRVVDGETDVPDIELPPAELVVRRSTSAPPV